MDPISRRRFTLGAVAAAAAQTVRAQQQSDPAVFSTEIKVVNLLATVRTKKGEIVNSLTKDDFTLFENARPQSIRYFSKETDLPLTIGLMVDTSLSQQKVLEAERAASFRFFDQVLRPDKDKVFIMQFDIAAFLRQELTSSRRKLEESLSLVDTPSQGDLQRQTGGGTVLYDAVTKASRDILKDQSGRKALIVLSDGVDTGSETTLAASIEAAQRADAIIFSILFSDESYYGGGGGLLLGRGGIGIPLGEGATGRHALAAMAAQTGGSFYEVSKKFSIDRIYGFIEQELRSQYSIGFVSDQPVRVSEFRKLKLAASKGLTVQTREKYWAQR